MTTQIDGSTGASKVQDGVIVQADLGSNVVGNGPTYGAAGATLQSIAANTEVKLNATLEVWDTAGCYDSTNSRFQPSVAGYYQFNCIFEVQGANNAVGALVSIRKNNSSVGISSCNGGPNNYPRATISALVYLNGTTDYIEYWGCPTDTAANPYNTQIKHESAVLARAA